MGMSFGIFFVLETGFYGFLGWGWGWMRPENESGLKMPIK